MALRLRIRALRAWPGWAFWLAAVAAAGAVACFLPLLEVLGYELSLAISLVASLGAGHLAASLGPRLRAGAWVPGGGGASIPSLYGRALAVGLSLLAVPLALSLANGLRVPPCNLAEGMLFFALLPGFSVAAASATGLVLGLAFARGRAAVLAWYAVWLAGLAAAVIAFRATPAVFLYGPFFGWFPGVLYDTLVEVRLPLATYRIVTAVDVAALLAVAAALFDPDRLRLAPDALRGRRVAAAGALVVAALVLHGLGPRLGHAARRCDLERELPVAVARGRLELRFPVSALPEEIGELAEDAAFSLDRVDAFLEPEERRAVTVFFFRSAKERGRLMGASRTNVTKPWRSEIYVLMGDAPHEVLRHELGHAVAASFGRGPFGLAGAAGGLLPNPGLVEGVAAAAEGPRGELTADQWAAAMKRLGLLPPLRRAMGAGFFGYAASKAYMAAGSFVGWLRREHGPGTLRAIYGGASFGEATGAPLGELERRWLAHLDRVPLLDTDLAAARLRFDRPSVIGSTCVHEVARLEELADSLADEGDAAGALRALREARRRSGGSTDSRWELFRALVAFRDERAARAMAAELLGSKEMTGARRAQIAEALADFDARAGRCGAAADAWGAVLPAAASDDVRRRLQVKRRLCGTGLGPSSGPVLEALAAWRPARGAKDALAALRIGELAAASSDPWLDYLAGRQHFRYRDWGGALEWLGRAERHGLAETSRELRVAGRALRGQALFRLGRLAEARAAFAALAREPDPREGDRELAEDWIARCDFASRRGRGE